MPTVFSTVTLQTLSPTDVGVAELKAVLGDGWDRKALAALLDAVGVPVSGGKTWSPQRVAESVDRLTRKRVLGARGEMASEWREPLMLRLARRADAPAFLAAVRRATPESALETDPDWRAGPIAANSRLACAVRLMTLANNTAEVERLIGLAEVSARRSGDDKTDVGSRLLQDCPTDVGFVQGLDPPLRDRLAATHVERFLDGATHVAGLEALIDALAARPDEHADASDWATAPRLDRALLRLDILGERPDRARARIARVRGFDLASALAAEATLIFLTDPSASSLPKFREALKHHRKAQGRRHIALPADYHLFHLLAMFAAGDADLHLDIEGLIDVVDVSDPGLDPTLSALLDVAAGRDDLARTRLFPAGRKDPFLWPPFVHRQQSPMQSAVLSLALAVIDPEFVAHRAAGDRQEIARWGRHAKLAARVLAEVHARSAADAAAWRRTANAFGPGYPRAFLEIVPIRASWERALDKVRSLLAPPVEAKVPAGAAQRRLSFRLNAATAEVGVFEQTAKRGSWTEGRPVALKRLRERDPKLDYLTPEDDAPLRTIVSQMRYYDEAYAFDPARTPLALIGHPRVFDAAEPTRRIDLLAYPIELVVHEEGERIRVALSHPGAVVRVFIEPETPARWRVIEVSDAVTELAAVLGRDGLLAPRAAREQVVALIRTENPRLPVRSELEGVATEVASGDARPILQIAPDAGGFHLRAVVRPLGEGGASYAPGIGVNSVLATEGGAHRRIRRDLAAETAALEAVAQACPALAAWREGDHDWRIEALDDALEALQELHAYPGPLSLEWPQGAAIRPTRDVGTQAVSLTIASAREWFDVKGQIRVDEDLVLDMAEVLARLETTRGRFVALDDGRYLALTDELRRRLDGFAAVTEEAKGGRRIGAAAAGAVEELVDAAGAVKADPRWTALVARIAAAQGFDPALPAGLEAELRDYQLQGFRWLARLSRLELGACLADDMGLGKTVQTLALLLAEAGKGPSLVVAPTSVCHNWVLEAARFAPALRVRRLSAATDRAELLAALGPGDVLVASYGLLITEDDRLAERRFSVAVFDEAQNLKNADTARAKVAKRIQADFRLALSGTPVENRLDELWNLFDTVTPGLLGSRKSFQRRFAGASEAAQSPRARQALKALVRPYILRRTKAAVLQELPPRTEITLEIEPGPEEKAFYEALRRRALETLAGAGDAPGQKRIRILAEITRLRRAACNPSLIDAAAGLASAKLEALLELVAELAANRHRALVFSQFTGHLDLVQAALEAAGVACLRLDGSTSAAARAQRVEAFQSGEGALFLISLKAGGTGLNLTGADYVIHLDPWWNPAVEDQATDRAHRMGQTKPVTVYRMVVKDSIEEKILALHATKRALAADFLDGAESPGLLGDDELMALIRG